VRFLTLLQLTSRHHEACFQRFVLRSPLFDQLPLCVSDCRRVGRQEHKVGRAGLHWQAGKARTKSDPRNVVRAVSAVEGFNNPLWNPHGIAAKCCTAALIPSACQRTPFAGNFSCGTSNRIWHQGSGWCQPQKGRRKAFGLARLQRREGGAPQPDSYAAANQLEIHPIVRVGCRL
jgi:hypothetical protein